MAEQDTEQKKGKLLARVISFRVTPEEYELIMRVFGGSAGIRQALLIMAEDTEYD